MAKLYKKFQISNTQNHDWQFCINRVQFQKYLWKGAKSMETNKEQVQIQTKPKEEAKPQKPVQVGSVKVWQV